MIDSDKLKAYEAMRENVIERFNTASDKRVTYETFGKPLAISFIVGFAIMLIIFYLF